MAVSKCVGMMELLDLTSSDGVAVVPVTARVAVGVEPVLHVGLLGPLVQSLHVEQVLLSEGEKKEGEVEMDKKKKVELKKKKHPYICAPLRNH